MFHGEPSLQEPEFKSTTLLSSTSLASDFLRNASFPDVVQAK